MEKRRKVNRVIYYTQIEGKDKSIANIKIGWYIDEQKDIQNYNVMNINIFWTMKIGKV